MAHLRDWQVFFTIKDKLADDLLHPSRSSFPIGSDDNIIVTKLNVVPDCAVEMMAVDVSGFCWQIGHREILFWLELPATKLSAPVLNPNTQ